MIISLKYFTLSSNLCEEGGLFHSTKGSQVKHYREREGGKNGHYCVTQFVDSPIFNLISCQWLKAFINTVYYVRRQQKKREDGRKEVSRVDCHKQVQRKKTTKDKKKNKLDMNLPLIHLHQRHYTIYGANNISSTNPLLSNKELYLYKSILQDSTYHLICSHFLVQLEGEGQNPTGPSIEAFTYSSVFVKRLRKLDL